MLCDKEYKQLCLDVANRLSHNLRKEKKVKESIRVSSLYDNEESIQKL